MSTDCEIVVITSSSSWSSKSDDAEPSGSGRCLMRGGWLFCYSCAKRRLYLLGTLTHCVLCYRTPAPITFTTAISLLPTHTLWLEQSRLKWSNASTSLSRHLVHHLAYLGLSLLSIKRTVPPVLTMLLKLCWSDVTALIVTHEQPAYVRRKVPQHLFVTLPDRRYHDSY